MKKVKSAQSNAQHQATTGTTQSNFTDGVLCMVPTQSASPVSRRYLSSKTVSAMFGYNCRQAFYAWVWKEGVPCVRLSSKRVMFPEDLLNDWLASRTNGGTR
jgi:predicted DNA-binding transcriptional regulator AlpA